MRKAFFAVILALLVLALATQVLASPVLAVEEPPPEVSLQWIQGVWTAAKATPIALVIALITCLAGYFSKTGPEEFKLESFLFTVLISFTVGFLSIYAGWSYTNIQLWLANGFLTWYLWKIAKILARIITKKFVLTTGPGPPTTA